ncbi:MAG: hypothetical protein ACRDTT_19010 [Pseudonocardiaceae bacterium]
MRRTQLAQRETVDIRQMQPHRAVVDDLGADPPVNVEVRAEWMRRNPTNLLIEGATH